MLGTTNVLGHTNTPGALNVSARRSMAALLFQEGFLVVILLAAYVVFLPSINPLPGISAFDSKRILQIALLLGNGIWLLSTLRKEHGPLTTYYALPVYARRALLCVAGLGCTSAMFSAYPRYALLEVFHLALLAALALSVAHLYRVHLFRLGRPILATLMLSIGLYLISFGVGYTMSLASPAFELWPSGHTGFGHIRFFNQYQTWTLPLTVLPALAFLRINRQKAFLLTIPAAAWWMLLFASGGRGTLLSMIIAGAFVLMVFRREALPWLGLQGAAAALGAIIYSLLFKLVLTTNASLLDRALTSDAGRFWYWNRAIELIQENWLLGIGPMHHASFVDGGLSHPHNVLLQFGLEWGIPATLLLAAAVLWGMWAWIRQTRRESNSDGETLNFDVRIALTAALVAAGTHALVSGVTVMPMSQTLMACVVGLTLGIFLQKSDVVSQGAIHRPAGGRRIRMAVMIFVAICLVLWGSLTDVVRHEHRIIAYNEAMETKLLHPRFWYQGNIRY